MGSGHNNRKDNDTVYIKRPVKRDSFGNVISNRGETAAEVCLPSFELKIKPTALTKEGIKVQLKAADDRYEILIGADVIGKLSKQLSEMISKCAGWGVRYGGELVESKEGLYARFTRL
jgi:hypothetical protein